METHDFKFSVNDTVHDTVNGWTGKIKARMDNGSGNRYRIHYGDGFMDMSNEADLELVSP